MIKAIETRYKGYRFRSRTEAKFAVLFDNIDVKWEYEKEGFNLNGKLYLPDFWLPDFEQFVEIKGKNPTDTEMDLCETLCEESKCTVSVFWGLPELEETYEVFITNCCNFIFHLVDQEMLDCFLSDPDEYGGIEVVKRMQEKQGKIFTVDRNLIGFAYSAYWQRDLERGINAAKSARFEHGETP